MHTWKSTFTVNGPDVTRFPVVAFPVDDALYAQIQNAVTDGIPFRSCPFFEDLVALSVSSLDLSALAPDWMEEDEIADYVGSLQIESCAIDDPGDLRRLEDRVRGLPLPSEPFTCWNEYGTRRYEVTAVMDDDDRIAEILGVQAEGLVSETANSSRWEPCYPDYNRIAEAIEKESRHA